MPTDEVLYRLECTQRLLSVKFVGKSKYCLEISKTWERLACSHNLFSILRSSGGRMKIESAGIYRPEANVGNFSFLFY